MSTEEMRGRIDAFDWARTPLGPMARWPQSLKTAVDICLTSRSPILLWWGPELIELYNDAYRPVLGATKHPRALGAPGREIWPEIWDVIGPLLDSVMTRGESTWRENQFLILDRNGYPEETYFTYGYSPIRDESGRVGGVFSSVLEQTERILSDRRFRTLRDLAGLAGEGKTPDDACRLAAEALERSVADVPFALLYLLEPSDGGWAARLACAVGLTPGSRAAPTMVTLRGTAQASPWPLEEAVHTGRTIELTDLATRVGPLLHGPWPVAPHTAVVLPLSHAAPAAGAPPAAGVLVAGVSARRALDDAYRGFYDLVAGHIAASIANARAYDEERRRAAALAELDRAKTAFFSNVSHEFRTPLTLMLGPTADILGNAGLPAPVREQLEVVQRNALRLQRLVNSLLDFSRVEAGRVVASFQPTDLAAYTADLASAFRSAIERAGIALVVEAQALPGPVYIDREMWEKIIFNLLSNALKHTFSGSITVRVSDGGTAAIVEVGDTGVGIPADELPRIFERFHRVANARSRTHEGTGIGLALVQELLRRHAAPIDVTSREGVGTTFRIALAYGADHLPADRVVHARDVPDGAATTPVVGALPYVEEAFGWLRSDAPPDPGGEAPSGPRTARTARTARTGRTTRTARAARAADSAGPTDGNGRGGARILLADDNADMREYVARLLQSHGWTVEAVADGRAALAAARARRPDLVLTDVMMPGLDGFQLLRALRAEAETSTVPIVMVSARAGEEARIEGAEAGADDYLVKPFGAQELLARVGAQLGLSRERGQLLQSEREARAEAERARERLAGVLKGIADAFVAMDREWRFTYVNWHAGQLLGRAPETLIGRRVWSEFPESARGTAYEAHLRVMDRRRPEQIEVYFPPLDRWFESRIYPSADGVSTFFRDITDRKRAEMERARLLAAEQAARREAEAANKVRTEFLAAMSHELRTPLNAIGGHIQLLELGIHGPITDEQRVALARAQRSQQHLLSLINDVLNFAKLEAGRVEYALGPTIVADVVADIMDIMEPQLSARQLRYDVDVPRALVAVTDGEKLGQILLNLLSNAVKFTEPGGRVSIAGRAVSATASATAGATASAATNTPARVLLTIADTGIGIPAEKLDTIFEPFVQVRQKLTERTGGTGLGLSISRDLARALGGELTVESTVGRGTTFTIALPGG